MTRSRWFALFCLALVLAVPQPAAAQTTTTPPPTQPAVSAPPAAGPAVAPNLRFFQFFFQDPAIVERQWWGGEFRYQSGAVPPIGESDGYRLAPVVAFAPFKNFEVGGTMSWTDYNLDDELRVGNSEFSGDSGLSDMLVWGKYRFLNGPTQVSAGAFITLPTGDEEDGLGTGEVNFGFFGGIRVQAAGGYVMGAASVNFWQDAEVFGAEINGKTGASLGGGYMYTALEDWAFSGELTVESERYDGFDSDFRVTGGAQYTGMRRSYLRGAVSLGLTDGAPDFEIILGYAFAF